MQVVSRGYARIFRISVLIQTKKSHSQRFPNGLVNKCIMYTRLMRLPAYSIFLNISKCDDAGDCKFAKNLPLLLTKPNYPVILIFV